MDFKLSSAGLSEPADNSYPITAVLGLDAIQARLDLLYGVVLAQSATLATINANIIAGNALQTTANATLLSINSNISTTNLLLGATNSYLVAIARLLTDPSTSDSVFFAGTGPFDPTIRSVFACASFATPAQRVSVFRDRNGNSALTTPGGFSVVLDDQSAALSAAKTLVGYDAIVPYIVTVT